MKILLVNKFFYPKGGAETVFFQEREFLRNKGHEVIEFTMNHPDNIRSDYSDYFVRNVDYKKKYDLGIVKKITEYSSISINFVHNRKATHKIRKLIKEEKPDIAHLHNVYHQLTPSIIPVLKKTGIKVALTLHDYKLICPNYLMLTRGAICERCRGKHFWHAIPNQCEQGSYAGSFLLAAEAYWHKWANSYDGVDLFIAPSQFMAEIMTCWRIPKEKMFVLHNGIDVKIFAYTGEDEGYAVYFGRISREKGVETLLRAHKLLNQSIPLKIIGTGTTAEDLRKKYKDADFVGFKHGKELHDLLSKAAFVVVPSEWYENCSMAVLEAMAFGKPVIGAHVGGIPEQIQDGITGLLFEMGSAEDLAQKMRLLAENVQLRKEMGKAARTKLEREYSLSFHNRELLSLYKRVLHSVA